MKTHGYSDQDLCDAIWRVLCESPAPMTRREISIAIGRKKSPRIIKMLDHLVTSGYLVEWGVSMGGFVDTIYYEAKRELSTPCAEVPENLDKVR